MKSDTPSRRLPTLISEFFTTPEECFDNVFSASWKSLKLSQLIHKSGFTKRSGLGISEAVFLLLVWKWINVSSIGMFARQSLGNFANASKDVMYDLLKRPDISWRKLNLNLASQVNKAPAIKNSSVRTFVLDDTVKARRGKKMEGVSSHFDHTEGRHVMGEQVLTLGLATDSAFLPLDSNIFISNVKVQELNQPYADQRSVVAKRHQDALKNDKPAMAQAMIKRSQEQGIQADYLVADAWFGTKRMVDVALTQQVTGVFRMKKGNLKFTTRLFMEDYQEHALSLPELYAKVVKHQWRKVAGMPWKAQSVEAKLDLNTDQGKPPRWVSVKLLFVRGLKDGDKPQAGRKDWAVFLTTDPDMSMCKILEVYALRWSIEVYFKEAKQHLGFLQEQTVSFASHIASIHLTAMRYLILIHTQAERHYQNPAAVRAEVKDQMNMLTMAGRLWQLFRAIIHGALNELVDVADVAKIAEKIDEKVREFFVQSLQLDTFTMAQEYEPDI